MRQKNTPVWGRGVESLCFGANPIARLRGKPKMGLNRFPIVREVFLPRIVGNRWDDERVFAIHSVSWRCQLILGFQLNGFNRAQNLIEVSARAHGGGQDEFDRFVRCDDMDVSASESGARLPI